MAYRIADSLEESPDRRETPAKRHHDQILRQLVRWFEESEQSTQTSREKAERDRDYYDNKQWTEDEAAELRRRGQPVISLNVIRQRINYHLGMEKKQRRDPKAAGRGPEDQEAAEVATEALRYAVDKTDYHSERSRVWENIKIEGCGALEATLKDRGDGNKDLVWQAIPWDRLFYDPHSARGDFSDARYIGQVQWMDEEEVLIEYPNGGEALKAALTGAVEGGLGLGNTYEDRPRWQMWADPKRKRIRAVQIWYLMRGEWCWAEFCKGGILAAGPSPFVDDLGESLCGILAESCYIDRENMRYGEVRDLIDPQDEVNKRRSKALHLLNTRTVITEVGAIPDGDREKGRREVNRPDGWIEVAPGRRFDIDKNIELAQGQSELLGQAMAHIMSVGPNAALLGKGTEDQSGRAIEAQQMGGMIELGDGLDVLRRLDHRVFRFTWWACRRYWTAPMWIRVSEQDDAPRWLGLNQFDPMTGQLTNVIAETWVDIVLEDAPDVPTLQGETFAAVMDVLSKGAPPPVMKFIAEMHPGLKPSVKRKLAAMADQMLQQPPDPVLMAEKQAQVRKLNAEAAERENAGQGEARRAQLDAEKLALERQKVDLEHERMMLEAEQQSAERDIKMRELDIKDAELATKRRELALRSDEVQQTAEIERERMEDGRAARKEAHDMARLKMARDSDEREDVQAELDGRPTRTDRLIEQMAKGQAEMIAVLRAPRRVRRGADGRVEGVE